MATIKKKAGKAPAKKSTINNDFAEVVDKLLLSLKSEVMEEISQLMQEFNFPGNSIPFSAINLDKAMISGDVIAAGSIRKFSSTGIEDLAKTTKLTIMDNMVVIENKLIAQQLSIKGNVEIDGNVTILGDTGFDKTTTNKLVHSIAKQVYSVVKADVDRGLQNISGDHVKGGTITNFSSTGIEDLAESTQLTIMKGMVVVEGKLATNSLFIKENAVIDGDLTVKGDLLLDAKFGDHLIKRTKEQVITSLETDAVDIVITKIKDTEFDVKNILIRGRALIDGETGLAAFIRESRLTQVGILKELQVSGEAQLCSSFYAGNKRVGINTTEPAAALAVWDEEIEIVIGKHSANRSYLGTLRAQEVVLGAHNKTNIILTTSGLTAIKTLVADQTRFYSAAKVPNFESTSGAVCFNTKPDTGKPYGWICLGGARWGIMGLVE